MIRFRTLGCYPLTGAIESQAATIPEIIRETIESPYSERRDRVIDGDLQPFIRAYLMMRRGEKQNES